MTSIHHVFAHLNRGAQALERELEPSEAEDAAAQRLLDRLGEYAALAIGPLNMRPTSAVLLAEEPGRVEVRVSTAGRHIVLVLATQGDLAAEVFFLRSMALKNLPAPRLIGYDLCPGRLPCTYALLSHVSGGPLDAVADQTLQRVAGRGIGRSLRRLHQCEAPSFGRPGPGGRWAPLGWHEALLDWLGRRMVLTRAEGLLGPELAGSLRAATLDHPDLVWTQPRALHGAVRPACALVTVGESIQLEALHRPGDLVAGDPLFDLAHALLPQHPPGFRQGLVEGYCGSGPLDLGQERRLRRLELLLWAANELERADVVPEDLGAAVRERLQKLGCG